MGRKTNEEKQNETTAVAPISVDLKPVKMEQPEAENVEVSNLPKEWQSVDALGGFPPSPVWEEPGEAVFGVFVNMRGGVGPNNSRLYEIMAHVAAGKKPELISIWGSTALDRCFDSAFPPIKSGDKLGIIYIGEKETKRKQNPVKLFKVLVKRAGDGDVESITPSNGKATETKPPVDVTPKGKEQVKEHAQTAHASK